MRTAGFCLLALLLTAPATLQAGPQKTARPHSPSVSAPPALNVSQALDASAQVLLNVIRPGFNPIPLAVLNKAHCAVFINSKGAEDAWGIASCRLTPNQWSAPVFVSFHDENRAEASTARELLVLVMSDSAARSLKTGRLALGPGRGSQPGLLIPGHASIREDQITADILSYNHVGARALQSLTVHASVASDEPMTRGLYSRAVSVPAVLGGRIPAPRTAARYVTALASFFNTITPEGIIIHHSATLPSNNRVPTSERQVDLFHQQRGFAVACFGRIYHVAYHYFILPNGTVKAGRPENCQGAHAHGYNAYLGISVAGDFSSVDNPSGSKGLMRPTPAQIKALYSLSERLMSKYRIPPQRILRHSDVSNTACPGDRFPFGELVARLRRSSTTAARRR
jgi:N-acetylmuramoyl-L-alanine amidase